MNIVRDTWTPAGPITEAQIFLTRECTTACGYCKLIDRTLPEPGLEQWKRGIVNLGKLGIRTVKILGGEPTIKPWLAELIRFIRDRGIRAALLSNSTFDDTMLTRLLQSGLEGYFASVDGLSEIEQYDGNTGMKSSKGYSMLLRLRDEGLPLLAANAVIHRGNMKEIPELCERLSEEGFYINLCILQHTRDGRREFSRVRGSEFGESDREELEVLGWKLADMHGRGVRIAVPERYLLGLAEYGIDCSWQCSRPVQLRIDSDGGLMFCNEYRTGLAERYNVFSIGVAGYREYLREWEKEREMIGCGGCYWSCFIHAEENIRRGGLEFSYSRPS